ncbi:MAG TPA: helix-turn-helix domain-containing protein [Steroidobacteraceae bacterium]|nr:helix-turn-helix domain-containing protein [Steroidobacteraceae bacterium]
MPDYHAKALSDALRRLAQSPSLAATIRRAAGNAARVAAELQRAVLAEVPQYSESMNPELLPESARHWVQHTDEILRLLRGGRLANFDFVREHARRRAEQRFPLEATLHAFRSGHKVLSRWLRESHSSGTSRARHSPRDTDAITDFAMEYSDAISTTFAGTYSSHTLLLADLAGDQRAELLQVLLDGRDEADPRVARILREAGFPKKQPVFCVALARSVDPAEMLNAARARRLADSIEQILAEISVRRLIDVHANKVTMVFSEVRRESGWTAPRGSLAMRIGEALDFVGNAAFIGVSSDVASTSQIPIAHREALAALELAELTQRVVRFADIPTQRLLLYFAGEEFRRVLPGWSGEFYAADKRARGTLTQTLRAYADADMNMLKAALALDLHPNTLYARFERIFEISGLHARFFNQLNTLLIVAGCRRDEPASGAGSLARVLAPADQLAAEFAHPLGVGQVSDY